MRQAREVQQVMRPMQARQEAIDHEFRQWKRAAGEASQSGQLPAQDQLGKFQSTAGGLTGKE